MPQSGGGRLKKKKIVLDITVIILPILFLLFITVIITCLAIDLLLLLGLMGVGLELLIHGENMLSIGMVTL